MAISQVQPVKWNVTIGTSESGDKTITATATIDDGWSLYSQHTDPEGPVPTNFTYSGVKTIGKTIEVSESKTAYSDLFELEVTKFQNKAVFTQQIEALSRSKTVQVGITFMCCDGLKCLPPTEAIFDIKI